MGLFSKLNPFALNKRVQELLGERFLAQQAIEHLNSDLKEARDRINSERTLANISIVDLQEQVEALSKQVVELRSEKESLTRKLKSSEERNRMWFTVMTGFNPDDYVLAASSTQMKQLLKLVLEHGIDRDNS